MVNRELYNWVTRGKQRRPVIMAMDIERTPSQIRRKSRRFNPKISLNNTSDVLADFKKQGLAVCLNEEARKGRRYELTELGEEIRIELVREKGEKEEKEGKEIREELLRG